jgi:hypothetical protein
MSNSCIDNHLIALDYSFLHSLNSPNILISVVCHIVQKYFLGFSGHSNKHTCLLW